MPELGDLNRAHPLTNRAAWAALTLDVDEHEAAGDALVGYGSMRLATAPAMPASSVAYYYIVGGEFSSFGYPVSAGDAVSAGITLHLLERTGGASAYLQMQFYSAAGAPLATLTGNPVTETGELERSVIHGAIAAVDGYVSMLLIFAAGAAADPAPSLDLYAGQPQLHVGAATLPRYQADHLPAEYDVRVGPLAFTWPSGTVEETLGDT